MKRIIILFCIYFSFLIAFSNSSQSPQNSLQDSMITCPATPSVDSSTSDDADTTNSNSTQGNMTTNALPIAVSIIAAVIALFGLYKFYQIEKIKDDFKNLRDNDLGTIRNELIGLNKSIEKEKLLTARLSHILQKNNETLYDSFNVIVEENKSYELSKIIMLNYHITRLYISCLCYDNETATNIDLFDTFSYLKENGRIEDIPHLVFLSQNHPNAKDREQASAVIGYIQARPKQ